MRKHSLIESKDDTVVLGSCLGGRKLADHKICDAKKILGRYFVESDQ